MTPEQRASQALFGDKGYVPMTDGPFRLDNCGATITYSALVARYRAQDAIITAPAMHVVAITTPASNALQAIREVLLLPDAAHAADNLEGALYDIKRLSEAGKPTDAVCIRTIERVIRQLHAAELALW